ncbi:hypothetical protein C0995_008600 [Termitomyces sp. Mi166|nr:hypothetical protein C0995_008600 [Termitomyces sp. Mi166\
MTWPQISYVAEDHKGRIVGYVLAKIEERNEDEKEPQPVHGHVNSISVLRSYRRLGLAKKLMMLSRMSHFHEKELTLTVRGVEQAMKEVYKANYVSLHVRKSNKAAIGLYRDTLGFEVAKVEKRYCEGTNQQIGEALVVIGKHITKCCVCAPQKQKTDNAALEVAPPAPSPSDLDSILSTPKPPIQQTRPPPIPTPS